MNKASENNITRRSEDKEKIQCSGWVISIAAAATNRRVIDLEECRSFGDVQEQQLVETLQEPSIQTNVTDKTPVDEGSESNVDDHRSPLMRSDRLILMMVVAVGVFGLVSVALYYFLTKYDCNCRTGFKLRSSQTTEETCSEPFAFSNDISVHQRPFRLKTHVDVVQGIPVNVHRNKKTRVPKVVNAGGIPETYFNREIKKIPENIELKATPPLASHGAQLSSPTPHPAESETRESETGSSNDCLVGSEYSFLIGAGV